MINSEMVQNTGRVLRGHEAKIFHAIFLLPTLVIAGLAMVEVALRVLPLLG